MSAAKEEPRETVTYRWPADTTGLAFNAKIDDILDKDPNFDDSCPCYNSELCLKEEASLDLHVNVKTKKLSKKETHISKISAILSLPSFKTPAVLDENHSLLDDPDRKCERCIALEADQADKEVDDPVADYVNSLGHDCSVDDKYDILTVCRV